MLQLAVVRHGPVQVEVPESILDSDLERVGGDPAGATVSTLRLSRLAVAS